MIATGHTGVGAGIGLIAATQTGNPYIGIITGFLFGLVSHYLSDAIPHGHYLKYGEMKKYPFSVCLDILLTGFVFLIVILFKFGLTTPTWIIIVTIFGAQLPDIIEGLLFFKLISRKGFVYKENSFHQHIAHWHGHHESALTWRWWDVWQLLPAILSLSALLLTH